MKQQYVAPTVIPPFTEEQQKYVTKLSDLCILSGANRKKTIDSFHHRLLTDLAAPGTKLTRKLKDFHELDFAQFRAEAKKALKAEIPVRERGEWEGLFDEAKAEILRLNAEIAVAEREIDRLVYAAFDLTPDEIELLEKSLEGQA